jgi:hypothetical protein
LQTNFKDIFKIFSKVLKIKEKKQQLTSVLCKLPDRSMPTLRSLTQSRLPLGDILVDKFVFK